MLEHNIVPSSVAPSKCSPAYFAGGRVRALRHSEIKELEQQFIDGAVRVKKAGCDGVSSTRRTDISFSSSSAP